MYPRVLPVALIALILTWPVFALPTSTNDQFRALSLKAPRRPEPPICCLKPLPPLEVVEEEVLLSFEEWKAKQRLTQTQERRDSGNRSGSVSGFGGNGSSGGESMGGEGVNLTADVPPSHDLGSNPTSEEPEKSFEALSPHFRVPLTDRFNYASLDCSARVHTAHKSAKSPSSILTSKRDRYMLSPCVSKGEKQFVVIELCEDIRLDTVQLANFEFFSGVFKDFTVSVAKTYTTDSEGWISAGTYRAKNVRGVQSFHPPTSLRDFYRYLRIDFHSHYSNEYYCPISLLRVYGLTHLEQWKWDIWEAESRAKLEQGYTAGSAQSGGEAKQDVLLDSSTETAAMDEVMPETDAASSQSAAPATGSYHESTVGQTGRANLPSSSAMSADSSQPSPVVKDGPPITQDGVDSPSAAPHAKAPTSGNDHTEPTRTENEALVVSTGPEPTFTPSKVLPTIRDIITSPSSSSSRVHNSESPAVSSTSSSSRSTTVSRTSISITASSPPTPSTGSSHTVPIINPPINLPPSPPSGGGESIYRTIMNRLTALESNHTLYVRYVEQQTSGVREVLKRLTEEVGRIEGIGRAQALTHQRSVHDWERQRYQLQMEYGELMSRVDYLAEEIILEKRLGIAQLCLLLAVLVFMVLTRGSRGEAQTAQPPSRINKSVREWGKRHLSFSSDWTDRFKSKVRSQSPHSRTKAKPIKITPLKLEDNGIKFRFPIKQGPWTKEEPLSENVINLSDPVDRYENSSPMRRRSHSRTPSARTPVSRHFHRPITPLGSAFRPQIQRSNSLQGPSRANSIGVDSAPRSAKRWARTAHLHEYRGMRKQRDDVSPAFENDPDSASVSSGLSAGYRPPSRRLGARRSPNSKQTKKHSSVAVQHYEDDGEGDCWIDTDFSMD